MRALFLKKGNRNVLKKVKESMAHWWNGSLFPFDVTSFYKYHRYIRMPLKLLPQK